MAQTATSPAATQPDGTWSANVLDYPAGTTVRASMLVGLVLTAGVFVGDWLYLGTVTGLPAMVAPAGWLVTPPLVALAGLVLLVALSPALLERRRHFVEVPGELGRVARGRLLDLSAEAGLRAAPRLMWNPVDQRGGARAYGTPGNYRVAVTPALIGAAGRRPQAFDAVLRHEIAHIANRDVLPAAAARVAGQVVIALLALPVLWRLVDHDLSLLPDFLWRALLLVLLVRAVRAAVLRSREHYADVRAAARSDQPLRIAEMLAAASPGARGARARMPADWFSLHPAPARRAAFVGDPRLLGRPGIGELFTLGLLPAAAQPLLMELFVSLGRDPVTAGRASHTVVYAALGAGIAAIALRSAGTGTLGYRPLLRSVAALIAGAAAGSAMSLAGSGLLFPAPGLAFEEFSYVQVEALTCAVAGGALLVMLADGLSLARREGRPRAAPMVLLGMLGSGLAATAAFPVALVLVKLGPALLREAALLLTRNDAASIGLALVLVAATAFALVKTRRWSGMGVALLAGAGTGAAATAAALILRHAVTPFENDDAVWTYYVDAVWIAISAAAGVSVIVSVVRREGSVAAVLAGCVAGLMATLGYAATDVLGTSPDWQTVSTAMQNAGLPATLMIVPLAALASALSGASTRRGRPAPPSRS